MTRVVYTPADLAARAFIKKRCNDAGLSVREDAIGNTFARWEGQEATLAPVGTGSHIDAIPHSGRFDGTVGVIGGLAAIRALKRAGFRPVRPIELLIFTSEEPTRFGMGCLGSRTLAGSLSPKALLALKDADGRAFDDIRREAGFHGELGRRPPPIAVFRCICRAAHRTRSAAGTGGRADRYRHRNRRAGGAPRHMERSRGACRDSFDEWTPRRSMRRR